MSEKGRINPIEAEEKAKDFIEKRHAKVERIFFRRRSPEENVWVLKGEVEFKRTYFFVALRTFEAQVDMNTGEVTSYEETNPKNLEKPY